MDKLAWMMVGTGKRPHPLNKFLIRVLGRQWYRGGPEDLGSGWSPQCVRRNISAHHSAGFDDGAFANPDVREKDAVWPDKDIPFDDYRALVPGPSWSPVEMRKDCRSEADSTVVSDKDPFRVTIVQVDEMGEPDVLANLNPTQAVQPRPQARSARTDERENVKKAA